MIVCPNCDHQNPDGAAQCEACYTPLPVMSFCPNCGAGVQANATFCGQCGYNLQPPGIPAEPSTPEILSSPSTTKSAERIPHPSKSTSPPDTSSPAVTVQSLPPELLKPKPSSPPVIPSPKSDETALDQNEWEIAGMTRLQIQKASLLHLQTNQTVEVPQGLSIIHIGKPNERIPPDIDVSGFPDSDIVSRVHADIRVEGDLYYIEDTGSSNGTYINHIPLSPGDRHRLRSGDRIALGKGDKLTFIFQLS
ncbi:FHA domain-containing protein [Gloeothece verrucosa]|uniref:FHA domain containing protein n=1 Tax=Gloeothece verrucosa (strain PCC 7822) TaxID=497965 RepID=E0UIN0_GLOV7|nr:FHA domain-containing protein [Gloeothece verrucosa]ADN12224.1 FHA domain containing protein [Gloeothece verrucosa PCC 7822]